MITFILGFLIGLIVMFLYYVKLSKEIIADILENCVEKIELYEWNIEKTVDFLNKTSNKLRKREKDD